MRARLANWWFAAAVLVCWGGLMLAQSFESLPQSPDLLVRSAADLQGVRRVVWDVDSKQFKMEAHSETTVYVAWQGDMRMSGVETDAIRPSLVLEREGDTVFVRARAAQTPLTKEQVDRLRYRSGYSNYLTLPQTLTLPAGVEELVWPNVHLRVAQNSTGTLPRFTLRSNRVLIGGQDSRYASDPLVRQTEKNDGVPGRLQRLVVYSTLASSKCSNESSTARLQSGQVTYQGGFFGELQVFAYGGSVRFDALEPGLKPQLFISPKTGLALKEYGFLSSIAVQSLSPEDKAQLQARTAVPEREPKADGNCDQ